MSSTPVSRRCRFLTICGSNEPSRSRGTTISTGPTSVSTVLRRSGPMCVMGTLVQGFPFHQHGGRPAARRVKLPDSTGHSTGGLVREHVPMTGENRRSKIAVGNAVLLGKGEV